MVTRWRKLWGRKEGARIACGHGSMQDRLRRFAAEAIAADNFNDGQMTAKGKTYDDTDLPAASKIDPTNPESGFAQQQSLRGRAADRPECFPCSRSSRRFPGHAGEKCPRRNAKIH